MGASMSAKVDAFDLDTSLRGVYVFSLYISCSFYYL
jgi:hypothetical protein